MPNLILYSWVPWHRMLFLNIINFHKTMIIAKIFWSKEKWWNSYSWVVHLVGGRGAGVVELAWKILFYTFFGQYSMREGFEKVAWKWIFFFSFNILWECEDLLFFGIYLSFELCQFFMSPILAFLNFTNKVVLWKFYKISKLILSWILWRCLISLSLMSISQMMMMVMIIMMMIIMIIMIMIIVVIIN